MKKLPKLNKAEKTQSSLLQNFYSYIKPIFGSREKAEQCEKDKTWHTIPYGSDYIVQLLFQVKKQLEKEGKTLKFLDVGSGEGNIVSLARTIGFNTWGIEKYIQAKISYGYNKCDAYDYSNYKAFDVIYFYQIFKERDELFKFNKFLIDEASVGTFIIPVGGYARLHEAYDDKRIEMYKTTTGYRIYRKIKN